MSEYDELLERKVIELIHERDKERAENVKLRALVDQLIGETNAWRARWIECQDRLHGKITDALK